LTCLEIVLFNRAKIFRLGSRLLRQYPSELANKLLRKMAQIISVFSPRLLDWLLTIRRIYIVYHNHHGFYPSLIFPARYTEKMQWRKLFDLDPGYSILCDKLAVRDFVTERVGQELLIPLLWFGDDPSTIPFDTLGPPYILKSSHASGHTIVVEDKALLDETATRETARSWLAWDHGKALDEPGYVHVPRELIIEKLLLRADGTPPLDRKIYVFHGKARVIQSTTVSHKDRARLVSHHTLDWTELPWTVTHPRPKEPVAPPRHLEEMIKIAGRLAADLDHARVDMYECDDRIYVGEMTLYSYSGLPPFDPDAADYVLGSYSRQVAQIYARLRADWICNDGFNASRRRRRG
jgi:hypothetical protein